MFVCINRSWVDICYKKTKKKNKNRKLVSLAKSFFFIEIVYRFCFFYCFKSAFLFSFPFSPYHSLLLYTCMCLSMPDNCWFFFVLQSLAYFCTWPCLYCFRIDKCTYVCWCVCIFNLCVCWFLIWYYCYYHLKWKSVNVSAIVLLTVSFPVLALPNCFYILSV